MRPDPARLVLGLLLALALTDVAGAASGAEPRHVVGTYSLTTQFPSLVSGFPSLGPDRDTVVIERFDSATGRFSGRGSSAWEVVDGTVDGDRITLKVSSPGPGDVPIRLRGSLHPNGTASGRAEYGSPGVLGGGTWRMTRIPVKVRAGFSVLEPSHDLSYGVELRNTSTTRALTDVRIAVDGLSAAGAPITPSWHGSLDYVLVRLVPPGATVYLGHVGSTEKATARAARVVATPEIAAVRGAGRLPRVTNVRLDLRHRRVTAMLTNTTGTTMRVGARWSATAVLYDRRGHIVGGGNTWFIDGVNDHTPLRPGRRASLWVGIPAGLDTSRVAAARVSVTNL